MPDEMSWRRRRLKEQMKFAWMWCKNNNLTEWVSGEEKITHETMVWVTWNWDTAECLFFGTYKKRRSECRRFADRVMNRV